MKLNRTMGCSPTPRYERQAALEQAVPPARWRQRCLPGCVLCVYLCAMRNEDAGQIGIGLTFNSMRQDGSAGIINRVDVGVRLQERLAYLGFPFSGRPHQSRTPIIA